MSFSIPNKVPNFGSAVREAENQLWQAARGNGGPDRELPLYKDKPYGIDFKHAERSRKRKKYGLIAIAVTVFLYFLYSFGQSHAEEPKKSFFSSWFEPKKTVSWTEKQDAVKDAFVRSWKGYEKYAWGKDVYKPGSKTGVNMGPKPLGWIIVDSLDTLKIMNLDGELERAHDWVKNELNYDMDYNVNTFETTIRMLGGLLSAHYLTGDDMYLDKGTDLANRLLGAFDSPSGLPYASVNLHSTKGIKSHTDGGASSTAEVSTLQLEFKYLAKLTGEPLYWEKVEKVMEVLDNNHPEEGLVPIYVSPDTGKYEGNNIRLGSRGDSYYEYLIKQYLQTEGQEPVYKSMYDEAMEGVKVKLIQQSEPNKLTFIGELPNGINGQFSNKMDHLVCFAGGMFALGATEGYPVEQARRIKWTSSQEHDYRMGMELTRTCYEMYRQMPSGLAPEIVQFNTDPSKLKDMSVKRLDGHNLQRPETVESLFILWRITKNPIYREWGWEIFQAFEKQTRLEGDAGYDSVNAVETDHVTFRDNMESFWLAETLKYLYLLFDDSKEEVLPLTDVVFNTEAHPFPKFSMGSVFKTGWARTDPSAKKDDVPLPAGGAAGVAAAAGKKVVEKVVTEKVVVTKKAAGKE